MASNHHSSPPTYALIQGTLIGALYIPLFMLFRDLSLPIMVMFTISAVWELRSSFDKLVFMAIPLILSFVLGVEALVQMAVTILTPSMILGRLSQIKTKDGEFYPLERLVATFALYTFGVGIVAYIYWKHMAGADLMMTAFDKQFQTLKLEAQQRLMPIKTLVQKVWPYMPGLYALIFFLLYSIGASLAQKGYLQAWRPTFWSMPRPKLALSTLYVPWLFWKTFAAVGGLAAVCYVMNWQAGLVLFGNMSLSVLGVFVLQGMAIVMTFAKKQKNPKMFLVVFYAIVVVIVGIPIFLIMISLFGLLEPWLDIRSRITSKVDS